MRGLLSPLIKLIVFVVVTVMATLLLAFTIANSSGGGGTTFSAIFTDAASLNKGDEVRIAGVRVGRVTGIEIHDQDKAKVDFTLDGRDSLPASTMAVIRYRNLINQRYVSLQEGTGQQGEKLAPGSTIPLERTRPAVNLTTLFGGFRPLFQTLTADDVNKLSQQIIQVFQGEAGTIGDLVRTTASLTNTVADKDQVIGQVITNLNTVLDTVNKNDKGLDDLIVNTQKLVSGLAADRDTVGSAVTSLSTLTNATADLLEPTRPAIQSVIGSVNTLSSTINRRADEVNATLATLPIKIEKLTRVASYGSWFQFYLCGLDITAGPGSAPQLNLPTGLPTINEAVYTNSAKRCAAGGIQ